MDTAGGGEQSSHSSCPGFQEGGWCMEKQPVSSGVDIAGRKFGLYISKLELIKKQVGLQYQISPTRPGARAEHSRWGWVLLALINWKRTHLAVPPGSDTHLRLYFQRSGAGSIDPDVQIHTHC